LKTILKLQTLTMTDDAGLEPTTPVQSNISGLEC
jgi:hypothetical protein